MFNEHINYAFNKLVENVYHTYKFSYFDDPYEDVKAETVAFLIEKIDRYDTTKGKGYSYFTIIARNYLIIQNNSNYAKLKARRELNVIDDSRNIGAEVALNEYQETLREFMDLWIQHMEKNLNRLFSNRRDIVVADTILELFRTRRNIENFNKKALYVLIRERTGMKTPHVTKVINVFASEFEKSYPIFRQTGKLK